MIRVVLVACYVIGHLFTQTILPRQTTVYLAIITNHFQGAVGRTTGTSTIAAAPATTVTNGPSSRKAAATSMSKNLLGTYWFWVALVILLVAGGFAFQCVVALLDGTIANAIRRDVFSSLLRQSPKFYHEHDSDRLTMVVTQYCSQIAGMLRRLLVDPVLQAIGIIVIGTTIYKALAALASGPPSAAAQLWAPYGLNGVWLLFGVTALFAMALPWITNALGKYLQHDAEAVQEQNLAFATLIGGALKAPEEIQAMRAEAVFERKHDALLERSLKLLMAQSVTMEKINAFGRLPGTVVLAAFIGAAIYLETAEKGGDPGTIVQVALLTPILMGAIQQLSSFGISVRLASPGMAMINSILGSGPDISPPARKEVPIVAPTLEVRNLVFSYNPGELPNVLDGVSFVIPPGKVTALVARPGQGKTTFFRLALRFYEPQAGEIIVGGLSYSALSVSDLRRNIVLMSQFPAFFYDSVRENMLVANPGATDQDIQETSELTGLWNVLEKSIALEPLDKPFAAGTGLSGGQRKLFALTRCLLRQPTFLFLDEPTTGMGPLEKFPLIKNMRQALEGKTVIVVDHDIVWQTHFCDHFVVLNDGKIVQEGPSEKLLAEMGLFKRLYDEASGGHREAESEKNRLQVEPL